jgi:hypothetical protein
MQFIPTRCGARADFIIGAPLPEEGRAIVVQDLPSGRFVFRAWFGDSFRAREEIADHWASVRECHPRRWLRKLP